jgi:hypothetical protein
VLGQAQSAHQAGARHRVVHEAAGEKLAARVVHRLLVEDVTGALRNAAEGIAAFKEKRAPRFPMRTSSNMPAFYPWRNERRFE